MSTAELSAPIPPALVNLSFSESDHTKDRRSYQYSRSTLITSQRFLKEFEGLTRIIGVLGIIVETLDEVERTDLQAILHMLKELLGAYRLFIDYRNDEGKEYCGVRVWPENNSGTNNDETGSSLYTRIKDICREIEEHGSPEKIEKLYDGLICCANCRLRAIETGKRDTRRINKRKNRRLFASIEADKYAHLDNQCPKYVHDHKEKK